MRNETLLQIAEYNYRTAALNFKYTTGDDRELNMVGYLLQQATELCIKHNLELAGVRYPTIHNVEDLLDTSGDCVVFSDEFYDFAPAISKWEAKTRYIKNYRLSQRQIERGFKLIRQFLLDNGSCEENLKLPKMTERKMDLF